MEEHFSTLTEAITSIFKKDETSLLSLDRICAALSSPNLFLESSSRVIPCSSISRRRISSILSSSDAFVRAGPLRSCMWALRPSNSLFLSDGALLSCICQVLTREGPLSSQEIVDRGDITGATPEIIHDFMNQRANDFTLHPGDVWWFAKQQLPGCYKFENVISALVFAFQTINDSASIEELNWLLCLSTAGSKRISRRKISRELSRRTDLFYHISRAKYALISNLEPGAVVNNEKQKNSCAENQCAVERCSAPSFFWPTANSLSFLKESEQWLNPCETPPPFTNDFFDPNEFFSIGFSGSFD